MSTVDQSTSEIKYKTFKMIQINNILFHITCNNIFWTGNLENQGLLHIL